MPNKTPTADAILRAFILRAHVQDAVAVDLEGHMDGKNQGFGG
jgi:hypothetical protein